MKNWCFPVFTNNKFNVNIFTEEMMEEIKVLELFSGIGGMHRAAQLAASYLPRIKLKVLSSPSVLEGKYLISLDLTGCGGRGHQHCE